ncbi:hypothetical protein HanXRQr2_Chr17g0811181 [Helianthus annuus]|uniref:Uncharacterized protein n=1 Tax=Helianthus annuus TaxID=4232 RepID=A0A9K3GUP3_HELAN|nr:hypothetical protein HanXRQr2_Chr17g0811181 [Helianthus annuus]KAJ0429693.1 hypothetical protein HanHA300_Chr17g0660361 [Helianthus annuus]KAJ0813850.1 hypothetical protein HanPSC8_Chr17g0778451 [Helianthus annuus]
MSHDGPHRCSTFLMSCFQDAICGQSFFKVLLKPSCCDMLQLNDFVDIYLLSKVAKV